MAASEDSDASAVEVPTGVDPMFMALHKLRCREFDDATTLCTDVLAKNPYDQVRAVSSVAKARQNYI